MGNCVDKKCQQIESFCVTVVGQRLKSFREGRGLSLREFADELGEDFTVLCRIERGDRYPPKARLKKFAKALSLTPGQLDALVAVESRRLSPHELLPEIPPAHISIDSIEKAADAILKKYCRAASQPDVKIPVPVEVVIAQACRLTTEHCDFKEKKIPRPEKLCGCLYPDGWEGKDRMVFANTGPVDGRRPSFEERRITVAHEAGHYVLHCGSTESAQLFFRFAKGPTFCREVGCEDTLFNPMEYQASVFAACLLMPREQFLRERKKVEGSDGRLAEAFEVPEPFVRLRAKLLNCE